MSLGFYLGLRQSQRVARARALARARHVGRTPGVDPRPGFDTAVLSKMTTIATVEQTRAAVAAELDDIARELKTTCKVTRLRAHWSCSASPTAPCCVLHVVTMDRRAVPAHERTGCRRSFTLEVQGRCESSVPNGLFCPDGVHRMPSQAQAGWLPLLLLSRALDARVKQPFVVYVDWPSDIESSEHTHDLSAQARFCMGVGWAGAIAIAIAIASSPLVRLRLRAFVATRLAESGARSSGGTGYRPFQAASFRTLVTAQVSLALPPTIGCAA